MPKILSYQQNLKQLKNQTISTKNSKNIKGNNVIFGVVYKKK